MAVEFSLKYIEKLLDWNKLAHSWEHTVVQLFQRPEETGIKAIDWELRRGLIGALRRHTMMIFDLKKTLKEKLKFF